ncbi:MAG: cupin domain-containing protein [Pyrinomonadaceae bacterium]
MENQFVKSGALDWKALSERDAEGVYIKPLLYDEAEGRSPSFLLKFDPGATYPLHSHPAGEEILVLEGEVKVGKDLLKKGDYLYTAPGNLHRVSCKIGCELFLRVPEQVVIIEPRG